MKKNNILILTYIILLFNSLTLVFSSGWHIAEEVLPGIFSAGNFTFNGSVGIGTTNLKTALTINGGIAKSNSILYAINLSGTHVNLGVESESGRSGYDYGYITITGGLNNTALGIYSFVGGGNKNNITGNYSIIVGGNRNDVTSYKSVLVGGEDNSVRGIYSSILGGEENNVFGIRSVIVGGDSNDVYGNQSFLGGSYRNIIYGNDSVIVGGNRNNVSGYRSVIVGGYNNSVSGNYGFIGSGYRNRILNHYSILVGGNRNILSGARSVLVGGEDNNVSGSYSVIIGGEENKAGDDYSVVLGGDTNRAYGYFSVAGGKSNFASGNYSWVFGSYMNTTINATNTFVWGFSNFSAGRKNIESPNSFLIFPAGVNGKVGIGVTDPQSYTLYVNGSNGAYFSHDVSALSFTDRTPYPQNLQTAYDSVLSMERLPEGQYEENNKENQLDHSKLHPFIKSGEGRDLSAAVSAQNEVIKDLINQISVLKMEIQELKADH